MARLNPAQIYEAAIQGGFEPGEEAITAVAIALAESGGDVAAWGDRTLGNSFGLWQIHWPSHRNKVIDGEPLSRERLQSDPVYAARAAHAVFAASGGSFQPWTTYWGPNRSAPAYRQYLNDANAAAAAAAFGAPVPQGETPLQATGGVDFGTQQIDLGLGGGAPVSFQGGGTQGSTAANTGEVPSFGWMQALYGIPEIKDLLDRATLEQWAPEKLEAEVHQTQWWRTTEPTIRQWIALQASDPAGAQQQIAQTAGNVKRMGAALGLTLSDVQSATIAEQALKLGWGEQEVRNAIVGEAQIPAGTTPEGTIGLSAQQVKALAKSYLTPISDQQALDFSLKLARGEISEAGLTVHFSNAAKQRFAWMAGDIDAGFTPAEMFDSHREAIARTLEVDPETIDLAGDSKWWPILEVPGEQRSMTLAEASRWARHQPEFDATDTARQQAFEYGQFLTESFGLRR